MPIDNLTIRGFKSIALLEDFPLTNLNVLIGANGAGKSSFIEALDFVGLLVNGELKNTVARAGGAENLLHFGSKTTPEMSFGFSMNNGKLGYRTRLVPAHSGDELYIPESGQEHCRREIGQPISWSPMSTEPEDDLVSVLNQAFTKIFVESGRPFHFHDTGDTSPMKKTARLHDNDYLRRDGSNLAAYLYYLKEVKPDAFAFIEKNVQRVAPFFDSFVLNPLKLDPEGILLRWKHRDSDRYFEANSLSDGTLRFVALATLLIGSQASVITIDEPELGLHPYAIRLLASLMKSAAVDKQIIVATQSSLFVDQFSPEDIIVVNQIAGASRFTRFDDSELKRLESWMEDYSLGELWEKNEFGGRVAS